jgi:hypothetical protein
MVTPAVALAAPVLERLHGQPEGASVLGGSREVVYLGLADFVIAVTGPGVPLMPNGVAVGERLGVRSAISADAAAGPGWLRVAGRTVQWNEAHVSVWDPRPEPWATTALGVAQWGAAVLRGLGVEPTLESNRLARAFGSAQCPLARELGGRLAIELLLESLLRRDSVAAAKAAVHLAGRGSGLTPEGDDFLSSCAAAVVLLGPAVADFALAERQAWLAALMQGAGARATTALSRTLLDLASRGCVAQPLHGLLAERSGGARWNAALAALTRVGSATGLVYGLGLGAGGLLLARNFDTTAASGGATKEAARC